MQESIASVLKDRRLFLEKTIIKAGKALSNGEISGTKARNMVCAMLPDDIGTEKHTLLVVKMKVGNDLPT